MDITKYNIVRVVTEPTFNAWREPIFEKGQVVHCTSNLGTAWLAKPINSDDIPRMVSKSKCRQLTEQEVIKWEQPKV